MIRFMKTAFMGLGFITIQKTWKKVVWLSVEMGTIYLTAKFPPPNPFSLHLLDALGWR